MFSHMHWRKKKQQQLMKQRVKVLSFSKNTCCKSKFSQHKLNHLLLTKIVVDNRCSAKYPNVASLMLSELPRPDLSHWSLYCFLKPKVIVVPFKSRVAFDVPTTILIVPAGWFAFLASPPYFFNSTNLCGDSVK